MIADAHSDLLLDLTRHLDLPTRFRDEWSPAMRKGGVKIQICAVSVDIEFLPEAALRRALLQVLACHRAVSQCSDTSLIGDRPALVESERSDDIGLVLALEGADPLGADEKMLDIFWLLGVRALSLCWNRRTLFADGAAEDPRYGLSVSGRRLAQLAVSRGIILDLAHASRQSFFDMLEVGHAAVMVSHGNCRSVLDTPRNLADDQLRLLADANGVLGVMAIPLAVDPEQPTVGRVADHIDHAVDVMGIDHVILGGDFMARLVSLGVEASNPSDAFLQPGSTMGMPIENLSGPEDYPILVAELTRRGYSGADLRAILSENLLRFLRRTLPATESTIPLLWTDV